MSSPIGMILHWFHQIADTNLRTLSPGLSLTQEWKSLMRRSPVTSQLTMHVGVNCTECAKPLCPVSVCSSRQGSPSGTSLKEDVSE